MHLNTVLLAALPAILSAASVTTPLKGGNADSATEALQASDADSPALSGTASVKRDEPLKCKFHFKDERPLVVRGLDPVRFLSFKIFNSPADTPWHTIDKKQIGGRLPYTIPDLGLEHDLVIDYIPLKKDAKNMGDWGWKFTYGGDKWDMRNHDRCHGIRRDDVKGYRTIELDSGFSCDFKP